ncbi:MAG: MMPL family transporter [Treponema sp.]|nr:MMPL family transporter [Treponema sp.]
MKKLTLSLNESLKNVSQKKLIFCWFFYHLAIILFFLLNLLIFRGKIGIDSDLFNLVPKSFSMDSVKKADDKMMAVTSQNVFILVANEDFSQAKLVAEAVYGQLEDSENFESLSLYNDVSAMTEITDFLYKYRWNLIDEKTADAILNDENGAEDFALNALSTAYSGFTMLPLDDLETDPFLLTEYNLKNYLNAIQNAGTAMSVKDGVLASQFKGKWYVMIRGILSKKGATLASKHNAITEIYSVCNQFSDSAKNDDSENKTEFVFSGTPFHSHESSSSASREISIIATLSMLIVIILLIFIFRSPKPLFYSVASILISIGIAVLATIGVFHKMHVITLVFGTSLIGSCIDYSLHFFTHWSGNEEFKSSLEIRNHIFSGLLMAIISTGICFAILLFAPFAILKQMSLFCLTGLVSSFLTTIAIYPCIKLPANRGEIRFVGGFGRIISKMEQKWVGRTVITVLFVFSIISICIFHDNVRIKNNVLTLYDMKGKLLNDEITAAQVIQYTPGGWYIVSGSSEDEALLNEEKLRRDFEKVTGGSVGYVSTSSFVPSRQMQDKSRAAYGRLLEIADSQLSAYGYNPQEIEKIVERLRFSYEGSADNYVSFEAGNVPDFIVSAISSAWLGEISGKWYTVLLPTKVSDYTTYRSLVSENSDAFFISKSQDISADLDQLTVMVLKFFLAAYVLMFIMLRFFYSWKQSFKIISVPLLIILVVVAVFAMFKIDLEFFSITGLILVFGLGLDYIIYMMENEKKDKSNVLEPFATMVSFVTTIISFGALALSSFKPVHLIGLSIFIGLATAYISSFFYGRQK